MFVPLLLTLCAAYVTSLVFASDAEGQILGAEIGGAALLFAAPFWIIYRGKFPFKAGLALVGLLYIGMIYLNCWAATRAKTIATHPGD